MSDSSSWLQRNGSKWGLPILMGMLLFPSIYDHLRPWREAAAVLPLHTGNIRILVEWNYHFSGEHWGKSVSYVFFPSVLRSLEMVTVSASDRAPPTAEFSSAIFFLAMLIVGIALGLWRLISQPSGQSD